MIKNNMIDYLTDSATQTRIPTYLNRTVVVDDSMPHNTGVFESWLFGQGALRLGVGVPEVPTETKRNPDAGNGGGQEVLYSRNEWAIHPSGMAYVGTSPDGGPSNAATANNLSSADSWKRAFSERKQIKMARFVTREY